MENDNITTLKELSQELTDNYFDVDIGTTVAMNFISGISFIHNTNVRDYDFLITISKNNKAFYINDIKENLLFIESYSRDELCLNINYIKINYIDSLPFHSYNEHLHYYKNIKDISSERLISLTEICFAKS